MMPFAALDIETTGRDPQRHQVLEIRCVVETDWRTAVDELPSFRRLVNPGEIVGEPQALVMNQRLLKELADNPETPPLDLQLIDLMGFIWNHFAHGANLTFAGKNVGAFDIAFLKRSSQWSLIRHKHRFIDVGNLFWRPETDAALPDLGACRERAGLHLSARPAHDALADCKTVIECVRAHYQQERT